MAVPAGPPILYLLVALASKHCVEAVAERVPLVRRWTVSGWQTTPQRLRKSACRHRMILQVRAGTLTRLNRVFAGSAAKTSCRRSTLIQFGFGKT